ncbi:MAG TPA: hypothetical protein VF339_02895 [Gammaproteobacteria bacterium]
MATDNYPTPILHALKILRANPHYLADARRFAAVHNTVAGSVLSLTLEVPRQYAEQAVREALAVLDQEAQP